MTLAIDSYKQQLITKEVTTMANVLKLQGTTEVPGETKVSKKSWVFCAGKPSKKSRVFC